MNRIIYSIIACCLVLSMVGCADIDSEYKVKSDSNTLTTLLVTFADGTGGFKPVKAEPYEEDITIEIPWYYPDGSYNETSLDSLFITGTIPNSSYLSPAFGLNDMNSPKVFSLRAQNGDVRQYRITAIRKKSNKAEINSFKLNEAGINAVIVNNRIIIPYTTDDLTKQTATVEMSNYASISPDPALVRNYSQPVEYTVTAHDGTKVNYTVEIGSPVKVDKGFSSVKKLWFKSAGDLNFVDYRQISIAVSGDYFLLPISNEWASGSSVKYYNRKTGAYAGTLNTTNVNGIYALASDSKGKILGINNLYAGQNVRLYKWDNATASPVLFAQSSDWSSVASSFYGRKLSIYGDLDTDAIIMSTTDGSMGGGANRILKWVVKNGQLVSENPESIVYPTAYGYVCKAIPTGSQSSDNVFINSNVPIFIDYRNGSSFALENAFSSNFLPSSRGATPALTYFEFNNAKYAAVIDASPYSSAMHIFDVTDPSKMSTSASSSDYGSFQVFNGESDYVSCPSANLNITGEIAVGEVSADGFTMTLYFMVTNGGVVAYELNCIDTSAF